MNDIKQELKKKTSARIEELPSFCREDFKGLIRLLSETANSNKNREQAYKEWVTRLFKKNKEDYTCSFCGNPVHPSDDGKHDYFCSIDCQQAWQRNLLIVLSAYME